VFGAQAVIGSIIGAWFIEKRAAVLGFVFGASVLGSSMWQLISAQLITHYGYRIAYVIMGSSLIVITVFINLCFLRMPDQLDQKPLGWEEDEKLKAMAEAAPIDTAVSADGLTVSDAKKTLSFWLIFVGLMLSPMSVGANKSNIAPFLTGEGLSTIEASRYTSLMALMGAGATAMSGFISQKLGNRFYMFYMHIAFLLGTAVLMFNASLSTVLLLVFISLYSLAAPIPSAMSPTVNSQAFGNKDYANMLASMAPASYIGSSIYPILTSIVLQAGGSLKSVYVFFACCNVAGLFLLTTGLAASPYVKLEKAKM
jgi:MFS family permease